jgi:diguanylate cyclase (GGDEF)-like protein
VLLVVLCIACVILLGVVRKETDAEFAFASMALLPVLAISWAGGMWPGLSMSLLAASMWAISDALSDQHFSSGYIPWLNAAVRLFTYGLVVALVTKIRTQLDSEREQASTDALTGLHYRRALMDWGLSETRRANRYGNAVTIVFLDLDHFKALNDTRGHLVGDAALKATAQALKEATRSSDFVARLGGDEFVVVLPQADYPSAVTAGQKIFDTVGKAMAAFPPAGASVGVAWFACAESSFEGMLQSADALMYSAKSTGRNNLVFKRHPK